MKRASVFFFLLLVTMGASGDGCRIGAVLPVGMRSPPAILPSSPASSTLMRTFTVDLRDYPEATGLAWDFGDESKLSNLSIDRGKSVVHQFPRTGLYVVTVHVFGTGGVDQGAQRYLITSAKLPLSVESANVGPIAGFLILEIPNSANQPTPRARRFRAVGSRDPDGTIASFDWNFGDGETGSGESVVHTFAETGRFEIQLTVTDDRGAKATATRSLFLNNPPVAAFVSVETSADGLTFEFDAGPSTDSDGTLVEFLWNFGDNTPEATGQVVSHTFAVPDTYTITLRVTDNAGSTATRTLEQEVTGHAVFVRSAAPDFGVVDTASIVLRLSGENFENTTTARLERGGTTINASAVSFINDSSVDATFTLTGAPIGDYDVVVQNTNGQTSRATAAFRIGTANRVRLETTMGDIVFELVADAPITTANFLQYVQDKFYDGSIFHRVVPGFVVQGGGQRPTGPIPGVRPPIQNEFSPTRSNVRSTVAMAKLPNDPNSATSEFFVNLADNSTNLDHQNGGFTVFANVVEGMSVVDAIAAVPLDGERPETDVIVTRARRE